MTPPLPAEGPSRRMSFLPVPGSSLQVRHLPRRELRMELSFVARESLWRRRKFPPEWFVVPGTGLRVRSFLGKPALRSKLSLATRKSLGSGRSLTPEGVAWRARNLGTRRVIAGHLIRRGRRSVLRPTSGNWSSVGARHVIFWAPIRRSGAAGRYRPVASRFSRLRSGSDRRTARIHGSP